ncbi:hypothetical protein HanIR_Chr09g0440291 [Helianthus annuus]|nr:hypothetical protein HanIR_Chr09g0440291 [Helianthus annuus]
MSFSKIFIRDIVGKRVYRRGRLIGRRAIMVYRWWQFYFIPFKPFGRNSGSFGGNGFLIECFTLNRRIGDV